MKAKIFEMLNAVPALGKLADEPLSVKTSYALAKLNKAVQAERRHRPRQRPQIHHLSRQQLR